MLKRRRARETALQILYQKDITGDRTPDIQEEYWKEHPCGEAIRAFASRLVKGTLENREKVDALIEEWSDHWLISRMGVIDRNILRMGVYEMVSDLNIPVKATLNEAIEIAKKYGTADSSKFINGVLDRIGRHLDPAA